MKRYITKMILGILGILFLGGCGYEVSEMNERLRASLNERNDLLESHLDHRISDKVHQIQQEIYNGNLKHEPYLAECLDLHLSYKRANAGIENANEALIHDKFVRDSVIQMHRSWHLCKETLSKNYDRYKRGFPILEMQGGFEDSLLLLDQRLSSADVDMIASELELLRSQILAEAIDMADFLSDISTPTCNWGMIMDTLSIIEIPHANPVIAGEEAQISFGIDDGHFRSVVPEYSGTGTFDPLPKNGYRTMRLKTSESMIPEGQNEADVPYNVTCKVPKADGTLQEMRAHGKIKVWRACDSPLRVPTGTQ